MSDQETERGFAGVVVDLVAVVVLIALAVAGLVPVFGGWGVVVVAVVAAALGLSVAVSTLRWPVPVLAAVLVIAGVVFGGPVGLRDQGLAGGVPDLGTLARVMTGSVTGWGQLLTTLPHVDLSGPPGMVPYLLGFLGASVATSLAIRTRSPGLPLLPLLAVLAAVFLLRRPSDDLLVTWSPVAFAVVATCWCVARGLVLAPERARTVRGGGHGRVARAVAALVVVVAALAVSVPLTSSAPSASGETLRGKLGPLPDLTGLDSPLRRFRSFTDAPDATSTNVHDKLLLTVTGAPAGSRLRFLTLDRYDGTEWLPGNHTVADSDDDAFLQVGDEIDNPTRGEPVRAQVSVSKAYASAWVPTVGSLTSLRFLAEETDSRRRQLRYDLATSTAVVPVGIGDGNDYEFTSILPEDRLTPGMRAWPGATMHVEGGHRADPLLERVLASDAPPMRKVFVLARYLRVEGRYSDGQVAGETGYTAGQDLRRLVRGFLLAPRPVGDDEQYAAAMALLANRVGVPARVVVGAVLSRGGKVRGKDVHAWVELRVADGTWRTLPTTEFMGDRPPRRSDTAAPRPKLPPSTTPVVSDPPTRAEVQTQQQARRSERAATRGLVVRVLPWLLLGLLLVVVPTAKLLRRGVRRRRGRPSDRMAAAWNELVDHARDLGIDVPVTASRPAQARALPGLGVPTLPRQVDAGVFGEQEPSAGEVQASWRAAMAERRHLGRARKPLARVWAPFNPTGLVPRRVDGAD